jgi:hypothetical protein
MTAYSISSSNSEPDAIMPVQFYDLIRRGPRRDGETRLVFAVLEDAVRTYLQGGNSQWHGGQEAFDEVSQWFAARDDRGLFSFKQVCEVLSIDANSLRKRLLVLTADDLPTKQSRSVGRQQVVRSARASRRRKGFARRQSQPLPQAGQNP